MAEAGRPQEYTQELADRICDELSEGKSLRTVCLQDDMPSRTTVFRWLRVHEGFSDQYTRAKQEAADAMAEELLDIADDDKFDFLGPGAIARSRLRVDTRKFLMAKMKPKKYGDSIDITSGGEKLPAPILGGASAVSSDDSDTETPQA